MYIYIYIYKYIYINECIYIYIYIYKYIIYKQTDTHTNPLKSSFQLSISALKNTLMAVKNSLPLKDSLKRL